MGTQDKNSVDRETPPRENHKKSEEN